MSFMGRNLKVNRPNDYDPEEAERINPAKVQSSGYCRFCVYSDLVGFAGSLLWL